MTPAKVASLATILLNAGVGFVVTPNKDLVGDWIVTAEPNGAVDASQIAAVEAQLGISSPVTSTVTFL